MLSFVNDYHVL